RERKEKLKRLLTAIMSRKQEIRDALYADFRKHPAEVDLTEIMPITSEIKHAIAHLSKWMRPRRVKTPLSLFGSSSYIHYEPKGVVLVIAPWNFPVNLTFGPVISAVAAGNCVMLKPSEHTPHASAIIKSIIDEVFDESEVAVIEGGIETSTAALALPFNHIFFTGAPAIGKIVMAAASKHLASVTLELGGKSPTIIDETASVDAAARRIAWAKFTNNGQICISPDYLFVHESKKDEFLEKLGKHIESFYGLDARRSDSYARIVWRPNRGKRRLHRAYRTNRRRSQRRRDGERDLRPAAPGVWVQVVGRAHRDDQLQGEAAGPLHLQQEPEQHQSHHGEHARGRHLHQSQRGALLSEQLTVWRLEQ
ncbi:MAG: aldehyde dehydrogenase family protein, partial [Deltaproteobacteria bacterium]|nr:aldehyde dehydrogenase family protein [Deltaproteobacteria bacterium]